MMLLKACKRCGGDLHITVDTYGDYTHCLQCGSLVDLPAAPVGAPEPIAVGNIDVAASARYATDSSAPPDPGGALLFGTVDEREGGGFAALPVVREPSCDLLNQA